MIRFWTAQIWMLLLLAKSVGATCKLEIDFSEGHTQAKAGNFAAAREVYAKGLGSENPAVRSISQIAMAETYVSEGKLDQAISEFKNLPADAPPHLKRESQDRIAQLERRMKGLQEREPTETRVRIPANAKPDIIFHVRPNGSNTNSAEASQPFATLERARDAIRSRRDAKAKHFEVQIHSGEYNITDTFKLTKEDSGAEGFPIIYRAADGEKPVFRGGLRLKDFHLLTNGPNFSRLPQQSRGKVYEVDLKSSGIQNILPLKLGGFASGNKFSTHPAHELFFNGKAMQLARGPNGDFVRIKEIVEKDGTTGYDRHGSKIGKFIYENPELARWKSEPDLLLYGYWFWDWADSYERVADIDVEKNQITLAKPYHTYGYAVGAPFYAINALSELDQPGEWYIDRQGSKLLFYPPEDLKNATIELSTFSSPFLELENAEHIRFLGITWELGAADAIHAQNCKDLLFEGCVIRRCAGNGIEISGGNNNGILSCDIYSMGRGGTLISGGNRKDLTPGNHFIENCEIYDLSRIDHTYTPAVVLSGVGNRIAHNKFHDVLSSAMRVGGNDHVIEYNEVYNAVMESDDQGGADMFGNATFRGNIFRYNYWHHIGNWQGKGEQPKCGQAGIRLDDAISGTLVYCNIFEHCSAGKLGFGGVQIHGGKDNIIDNNLFISCAGALSFSAWSDDRWQAFVKDALDSKEIARTLYLLHYPQLGRLNQDANENSIWRNRALSSQELYRRPSNRLVMIDNLKVDDSKGADDLPGFARIPRDEIGLYKDSFRAGLENRN